MSQPTMSQPLKKFWSALRRPIGLMEIPRGWRSMLGDEFALVARFLLPTQRLAGSVKCPVPYRHCIHEVIFWKGEYVTSCPDGCDSETLPRDDLVIHRIDVASLGYEVATSLGLEAIIAEEVPNVFDVWHVANYAPSAGFRFPVYLSFIASPSDLESAALALTVSDSPFFLVVPTRSLITQRLTDILARAKSSLLIADEIIGLDTAGQLACLNDSHEMTFAAFRDVHVPKTEPELGSFFFPTPPAATWSDVSILFKDAHTISAAAGGDAHVLNYTQLGMVDRKTGNPTKQWELLHRFAQGNGRIDDRRKGKPGDRDRTQKTRLTADLARIFRIEGHPFLLDADGNWRAAFVVAEQGSDL